MRYLWMTLVLFLPLQNFVSEPKTQSKKDLDKIILWEGELNAIYKDKGKIKIYIPHNPEYVGNNFEEIKENILKLKTFPIRQKMTEKKIGYFEVNYVEREREIKKGKNTDYMIVLWGNLKLRKKSYLKIISNDFYISMARFEESYIDPSETQFYNDKPTPPEKVFVHPKDKKEMLLVPAGEFVMGQGNRGDMDDYNPAFQNLGFDNLADVGGFYMDKYEVTNLEYEKYLKESGAKPPAYWPNGKIPEGKLDHPVISLTYREVEGYAKWAGKRLPTEKEWEKAARGPGYKKTLNRDETYTFEIDTINYPFGNKYDSKLCNCRDNGANDTISVYDLPTKGASYYGMIGMCGNAPEWTESWYEPYKGHEINSQYTGKVVKVIRGGSFIDSPKKCTVFARSYGGIPNLGSDRKAGFRLVVDKKD